MKPLIAIIFLLLIFGCSEKNSEPPIEINIEGTWTVKMTNEWCNEDEIGDWQPEEWTFHTSSKTVEHTEGENRHWNITGQNAYNLKNKTLTISIENETEASYSCEGENYDVTVFTLVEIIATYNKETNSFIGEFDEEITGSSFPCMESYYVTCNGSIEFQRDESYK